MKRIILNLMAITTILTACYTTTVQAEEGNAYYTNNNGVEMTQEQYEMLLEYYSEPYIAAMSEEQFLRETASPQTKVDEKTIYVETKSFINTRGEIVSTEENLITEEEYNSINPNARTSCGNLCWETTYKKLQVTTSSLANGGFKLITETRWKKMPKVKSYDVIGFRWENKSASFTLTDYYGNQSYIADEYYTNINYPNGVTNANEASNGVGISMNLADEADSDYVLSLVAFGVIQPLGQVSFYHTYQHAQSNISLTNSQKYSFGATGLGGVLKFSGSIGNTYDKMQGISYTHNRTF